MLVPILILLGGLVLILLGANYLVDGASSIAKKFGLSEFIIGVTIVGIGTSAPEMVASIISAIEGSSQLAIGNIVGSNIFNTLVILGITALIAPLLITKSNLKKDIPINIGVTVLLILLGMKATIFGFGTDTLTRLDGAIMLAIFVWYLWSSFRGDNADDDDSEIKTYPMWLSIIMIAGGLDKKVPYDVLGPIICEKVKTLVLLGNGAPDAAAPQIKKAVENCKEFENSGIEIFETSRIEDAVATAKSRAKDGDIVMLCPAATSFDMFTNFEERGNKFKDLVNKL
jgi:Ca2+/Na+ antiporter